MAAAWPYVQMSLEKIVDRVEILSAEATDAVKEARISRVFGIESGIGLIGFVGLDHGILDFGVRVQLPLSVESCQGLFDVFLKSL
jgi:hypothetical protein